MARAGALFVIRAPGTIAKVKNLDSEPDRGRYNAGDVASGLPRPRHFHRFLVSSF